MTKNSRLLIETNRITIVHKQYVSNFRCGNCGRQTFSANGSISDVIAIDGIQQNVELEALQHAQGIRTWHQALLNRLLKSMGK